MNVYIRGNRVLIDPQKSIGKGGEADVFNIGNGKALKLFKPPNHPDYATEPHEQEGARLRLAEHQTKLREFPKNLPPKVVVPEDLATDQSNKKIVGYVMKLLAKPEPLIRYSDKDFRLAGVPTSKVVEDFSDLHQTVDGVHRAGAVIGDFNYLNVLINKDGVFVIDADSFQFGKYLCRMYTATFVDPLLCDIPNNKMILSRPHTPESDWYAFAVMLMQCLLFVDPYGGIYRPKNKAKQIPHSLRPLKRITVFDPEVTYPKPAVPYSVLPDDLLQYFHLVFKKDKRETFPSKLLKELKWQVCPQCHAEHARNICPFCAHVAPAAVKEVTKVRGRVSSTAIFETQGNIIFAAMQRGKLRWLYHENRTFKREDGQVVFQGNLDPLMRFRIKEKDTLVAKEGQLIVMAEGKNPERISLDSVGSLPMFDANEKHHYWSCGGQLLRDGEFGSEYIGDVMASQTFFWVGAHFGFGFYRAGNINVAFVFDADKRGLNDTVKLPPLRGQLIDSTCFFSSEQCWFIHTAMIGGIKINQCTVINRNGQILATAQTVNGDGSWLGTLRGKCSVSSSLLASTDDGIVRVEIDSGKIVKTREFPDTEPFVDSSSHLFAGSEGIYVVNRKEVKLLKIG